jgi:transcriptional regulator with XRE-family HTH domain
MCWLTGEHAGELGVPKQVKTFGAKVRQATEVRGIGQRKLVKRIGTSAPYLNYIESSRRPAPQGLVLDLIIEAVGAEADECNDLAGQSRNSTPPDIERCLLRNEEAISLLRVLLNTRLSNNKIKELKRMVA